VRVGIRGGKDNIKLYKENRPFKCGRGCLHGMCSQRTGTPWSCLGNVDGPNRNRGHREDAHIKKKVISRFSKQA